MYIILQFCHFLNESVIVPIRYPKQSVNWNMCFGFIRPKRSVWVSKQRKLGLLYFSPLLPRRPVEKMHVWITCFKYEIFYPHGNDDERACFCENLVDTNKSQVLTVQKTGFNVYIYIFWTKTYKILNETTLRLLLSAIARGSKRRNRWKTRLM